jgi:hypothetical protein
MCVKISRMNPSFRRSDGQSLRGEHSAPLIFTNPPD